MNKSERIYRQSETSEKALERRLVEGVRCMGFVAVKMCDPMQGGLPDRLIVVSGGRTVWVELKSSGKRPTTLQESRIRQLRNFGHMVYVCDSIVDVDAVLDYIRFYKL